MPRQSSIQGSQLEEVSETITAYVTNPLDDFVAVFRKVQNLPMFTWVPKLVEGYNRDCMNIDEGNVRSVDLRKRLTII